MTGVGWPPMCSDWCHICNVSTLDIHSVGTQLKLLLAPQECKWDQLCVQVCKCEQQLEVVSLPVPCASATWTECAFLTWFGNQTLSRVLLPLHIVSAGLSLRAGQALSCYWQFDLQLATITVPSCLTVTAERRNAKQYKTHIKASEITNDHKMTIKKQNHLYSSDKKKLRYWPLSVGREGPQQQWGDNPVGPA